MNKDKIYSSIFYLVASLIGLLWIIEILYFSKDLYQIVAGLMLFGGCLTALIRAYKLQNYLLLLDSKPTINYFQHYKGMAIELLNYKVQKPFAIYLLIKPIFEKSDFDNERKQVNLFTYLTYILIILSIVLMNID